MIDTIISNIGKQQILKSNYDLCSDISNMKEVILLSKVNTKCLSDLELIKYNSLLNKYKILHSNCKNCNNLDEDDIVTVIKDNTSEWIKDNPTMNYLTDSELITRNIILKYDLIFDISIKNKQCELAYELKTNDNFCELINDIRVQKTKCTLDNNISISENQCKIDYKNLKTEIKDCSLSFKEYKTIRECNIDNNIIKKSKECNIDICTDSEDQVCILTSDNKFIIDKDIQFNC